MYVFGLLQCSYHIGCIKHKEQEKHAILQKSHNLCVFFFLLCGPQCCNSSPPLGTLNVNDPYIFTEGNSQGEERIGEARACWDSSVCVLYVCVFVLKLLVFVFPKALAKVSPSKL